jgi:hypothetical protein
MDRMSDRQRAVWICVLLSAATVAAYLPLVLLDFVDYDDWSFFPLAPTSLIVTILKR